MLSFFQILWNCMIYNYERNNYHENKYFIIIK